MRIVSIILFAICFISVNSATAQTKSCSKAQMAKCAKANNMTVAECAKKCSKSEAAAYLAKSSEETVDIVPVSLTTDQKAKVASAMLAKESTTTKTYQCTRSKTSCAKSSASTKVAALKTEVKKKAARA